MTGRAAFTVVETLVAFVLGLLVLQAAASLGGGMARGAAALADRAEGLAASRAAAWIVQEELEGVRAGEDVSRPVGDSISIRAFRGTARVCARSAGPELVVRWSGMRKAEPDKDSALVLRGSGEWVVRALGAVGAAPADGCGGTPAERWTLSDSVPDALLLRVFERGSYHLSDRALRYRIGMGGRQPLTPARLDARRSGLGAADSARLVLAVATGRGRVVAGGAAWERVFSLPGAW